MDRFDPAAVRPEQPEMLVLRALKLGDLLVAVPALRALRRAYPEHRMILAMPAWLEPLAELVGGIDTLLDLSGLDGALPLEPGRIAVAVNLHGNGAQSRALLDSLEPRRLICHRRPGEDNGQPRPGWVDRMHERHRWTRLLQEHGIPADPMDIRLKVPSVPSVVPGCAVVHVGAAFRSREWPIGRFSAVARKLAAHSVPVIFTGSAAERPRALEAAREAGLPASSVVAGELALDAFAAAVAQAAVVVSADTGAAHLASAYGTPSVVLFGPAPVEQWGPPEGPHIVLTDARRRRGDVFADTPDPALLAVSAADVLAAVRQLGVL
jgi:ADP-heptose:LPS heptosyltransferase